MSKARKLSAADKLARKQDEYERVMAAKRGLPPPAPKPFLKPEPVEAPPPPALASGKGDDFAHMSKSDAPKPKLKRVVKVPDPFDDIGFCFLCKATGCGGGVSIGQGWRAKPRFFCTTCGPEIVKWHAMRQGKLNEVEDASIMEAGAAMGEYLDSIGKTDLATLTEQEYKTFCRKFLSSYISSVRELARYNMPD